jgi:hypothetical protein
MTTLAPPPPVEPKKRAATSLPARKSVLLAPDRHWKEKLTRSGYFSAPFSFTSLSF